MSLAGNFGLKTTTKKFQKMKAMIATVLCSIIFLIGHGQNNEGVVTYKETIQMNIKLEGDAAQFASMIPKEQTATKTLHFSPDASIYTMPEEKENTDPVQAEEGGAMVMVKMAQPDDKFYADLKHHQTIEQRDFMSRIFLIEKEMDPGTWKMTGEQKNILGYGCQQAIRTKDSTTIIAWFTPEIPVSAGPEHFLGLPGLILGIDIDNGQHTIEATSVELTKIDPALLQKPIKGKKVTQEKFDAIVAQKQKELEEQYNVSGAGGGEGTVVVTISQ
jgi:GLPGLI family protein